MRNTDDDLNAPNSSSVERELWAAFRRLQAKMVKGRPATISYKAVAKEANRSRTLIGHDGCAYPKIREAIGQAIRAQKGMRHEVAVSDVVLLTPSYIREPEVNAANDELALDASILQLRKTITDLKKQNKAAAIKIATIDDENQQLREELARLKTELLRRKRPLD